MSKQAITVIKSLVTGQFMVGSIDLAEVTQCAAFYPPMRLPVWGHEIADALPATEGNLAIAGPAAVAVVLAA